MNIDGPAAPPLQIVGLDVVAVPAHWLAWTIRNAVSAARPHEYSARPEEMIEGVVDPLVRLVQGIGGGWTWLIT